MDETKKEDMMSDEDFGKLLMEIVKTVAKPGVSAADQLEALLISMICVAVPSGINPDSLLMFVAKGIVYSSGLLNKQKAAGAGESGAGKKDEVSYEAMMKRLPKDGGLKN